MDANTLLDLSRLALAFARVDRATYHEDGLRPEGDADHTVMLTLVACTVASQHNYQTSLEAGNAVAALLDGAEAPPGEPWTERLFGPSGHIFFDVGAVAQLAVVHDLLEAKTGDVCTLGVDELTLRSKVDAEKAALEELRGEFAESSPWLLLWIDRYEAQDCPESNLVRCLDKCLPKVTHALNGCVTVVERGMDRETLIEAHHRQRARLAEQYPDVWPLVDALFVEIGALSEQAHPGIEAQQARLASLAERAEAAELGAQIVALRKAWAPHGVSLYYDNSVGIEIKHGPTPQFPEGHTESGGFDSIEEALAAAPSEGASAS